MALRLVVLVAGCVAGCLPGAAHAQSAAPSQAPLSKELFGGYSYAFRAYDHTQDNPVSGGMSGWDAGAKFPLAHRSWLGLEVNALGYYRTDNFAGTSYVGFRPRAYFFLAGPRFSRSLGRFSVYVDGLVGEGVLNGGDQSIPSLESNLAFSEAVGGGVDTALTRRWALRAGGAYLHAGFSSSDNQIHGFVTSNGRIVTGLVYRF